MWFVKQGKSCTAQVTRMIILVHKTKEDESFGNENPLGNHY